MGLKLVARYKKSGFDIVCGTLQSTESTKDWDDKLTQEHTDCMLSRYHPKDLGYPMFHILYKTVFNS